MFTPDICGDHQAYDPVGTHSIPTFEDYCKRVRGRDNQIKAAREKMAADEDAPPAKRKYAEGKIQAAEEVSRDDFA
jgi:hypothetical protein